MEASFSELLRHSFAAHRNLPAVQDRHGRLSFGDLDHAAAVYAEALQAAGVRPGDIVPLLMRRSTALVVAQVAVIRVGAAYAPIDVTSPPSRQAAMLDQIAARVMFVDDSVSLPQRPGCRMLDTTVLRASAFAEATGDRAPIPWVERPRDALAYVMFTSGTTGVPKGVMVPQSGITRLVRDANYAQLRAGARWGFLSSPAFDAATLEVWAPLMNGGCCVVQDIVQPSLDDLAEFLLAHSITDAWLTSSLFSAMVDDRLDAFESVRQLLTGGERVSPRHARLLLARYPELDLINGYGPTENTTFTLCRSVSLADTRHDAGIPIGRPIRGTVVRIGTDEPEPNDGELLAGGDGVALGYLHDDALTNARFVHFDGRRWYRTGDLVHRRADGAFVFVGRADRQIKLQGNRIELDEVERVLAAYPGIDACVATVRGDSAESRHLVAYYHAHGAPPARDALIEYLHAHLPASAVPSMLFTVPRIPRTTTGKVDEAALEALTHDVAVTSSRDGARTATPESDDVTSETEQSLIAIWRQYFPGALIDRHANFLALGGTSLLALQVSAQVRRRTGKNLTPIDVLRLPLLSEQAHGIDTAPAFDGGVDRGPTSELELPLTGVQRTMLAGMQLDDSGSAYLVHVALCVERSERTADRAALRRAFVELASRHPALRMRVRHDADPTHARVEPALADVWWQEHGAISHTPRGLAWPSAVLDVINRPLDLRRHGVMRVDVWPIADTGAVLIVWTLHHIAIDEASIDRALFELDELLKGVTLQPVYGSPLGFATFEKAWTDRDGVRGWQTTLVNALGPVRAPLPRAPGRGAEFVLSLPADLSTALHAACSRWGATPFAPLLTAYGLAVQDVFGSAYRFVTTPFSRRVEAELVEPVGCLLDMHFVEAGARDSETDIGALARVRDTVLALQRPVFQPQRELAMAVGKVAPHVGAQLNAFGFTWRLNPSRIVPLGTERATVLRVPQQGARFGVTLHAWLDGDTLHCSIEALTAAIDDGRARALGDAFVRRLQALFAHRAIPAFAHTPATDAHGTRTDYAGDYSGRLRRAWSQWLNIPVGGIVDSSDFLRSGGNSLTAMRMTAQLRREHGLSIGTGEFLSRPTFQNLRALAREGIVGKSDFTELIGAADAERFVVFLPGNVGPTIEVYQLCLEVQRQLGAGFAVLIVDLEAILARAPDGLLAQYVAEHVALLLSEVGWERVVALAGYSSGGLLALELAQGAPGGRSPMVWLLDTYAPLTKAHTRLRAVLRPNVVGLVRAAVAPVARPLLRNARIAGMLRTHVRPREPQPVASIDHLTQRRLAYHDALYGRWRDSAFGETHLLQARDTIRLMNLVWRRASNGFTPAQHRVWQVHQLDGNHKDIPASRAGDIAALISERLRRAALTETDE